ncbi:MAG: VWA domain-containing protein [Planctomycetota bacterium]|jgi:Ca-activated chloride channel family protein|nr:VWA domain-containing protein [Planctomycetota bacterium]
MRILVLIVVSIAALAAFEAEIQHDIIVPQRHVMHWHAVPDPQRPAQVVISKVDVGVRIVNRHAVTTVDVFLHNPAGIQQEAEVLLPVPSGSVVTGLDFAGAGSEPSARLLPREEAVRLYRAIVSQVRDPALMEFVDSACVRTSVFPVPAHGKQRVRLVYEQHLVRDGARLDYHVPRSRHIGGTVPWSFALDLRNDQPIASVYSPSHQLRSETRADGSLRLRLAAAKADPGSFRLSWLLSDEAVASSVIAYPDPKGGGWFQIMAGAPAKGAAPAIRRQVTVVLDRSGSMNGTKIVQARAAAMQVIAGLEPGERFNLFCYNHGVEGFAREPVAKSVETEAAARAWLDAMQPRGGTNIHDALLAALQQAQPNEGELPVVLFLTDGVATVGPTVESVIRERARSANANQCRIFTFGVGDDVDSHLLEKIADDSGARSTFVLPGENIELATATVFDRLRGPVLRDLVLHPQDANGTAVHGRLLDVSPLALGDLYQGEELLVLGRYIGAEPVHLVLRGTGTAGVHETKVVLDPKAATTVHSHVPRLWASRRIATLVDAIRELGADGATVPVHDPRYRELVDEIVKLSTEFGILTEYTAFMAEEGSLLAAADAAAMAAPVFRERALGQRSGAGSVAQSRNASERKVQATVNLDNRYVDEDLAEVAEAETIMPQAASALYKRQGTWVEGAVLRRGDHPQHDRSIAFASDAYFKLADRLATEQRQGVLAVQGAVIVEVDGEVLLVEAP